MPGTMTTRKPFSPRQGSSRIIADASLPITINFAGSNNDETVRITKIGGSFSIMVRVDSAGNAKATSATDGSADTPVLVNTSLLLNKGVNPGGSVTLGVGPDGVTAGGFTVVQTGAGGVA